MLTLPSDRFLVLGHRGASAHAPENTVAAFRLAADQGADGVELDVRRTADNSVVIHHDPYLGSGEAIADIAADHLAAVAPHVPTFAEAMAACEGMLVNVEIKNDPAEPDFDPDDWMAGAVVGWLADHGWIDAVIVSSFNRVTIDRVKELEPAIATGQLIDAQVNPMEALADASRRHHRALHAPVVSLANAPELATVARGHDQWLLAWTVDDAATIRALRHARVNGVITNDPAGSLHALD